MPPLTPSVEVLKELFARIPTSVTVITTGSAEARYGATVGTLNVLSLDPPLLMFAMKQESRLVQRLNSGTAIGINVLAAHQQQIARRFATHAIDRFGETRWCEANALPRLDDVIVWIPASVRDRISLGDHMLITATVEGGESEQRLPLLHWQREFHSPSPVSNRVSTTKLL